MGRWASIVDSGRQRERNRPPHPRQRERNLFPEGDIVKIPQAPASYARRAPPGTQERVGSRRATLAAYHRGRIRFLLSRPAPSQRPEVPIKPRGESASFARRVPSREWAPTLPPSAFRLRPSAFRLRPNAPSFPSTAWGVGELCSPRTIAGGFGNPPRVPMTMIAMDPEMNLY
jgi:hypothetical protein